MLLNYTTLGLLLVSLKLFQRYISGAGIFRVFNLYTFEEVSSRAGPRVLIIHIYVMRLGGEIVRIVDGMHTGYYHGVLNYVGTEALIIDYHVEQLRLGRSIWSTETHSTFPSEYKFANCRTAFYTAL